MYLIMHLPWTTYMHFKTAPVPFTSNKIMSKTKYESISFLFWVLQYNGHYVFRLDICQHLNAIKFWYRKETNVIYVTHFCPIFFVLQNIKQPEDVFNNWAASIMRKHVICKNIGADKLICACYFASYIKQSLFILNKFEISIGSLAILLK